MKLGLGGVEVKGAHNGTKFLAGDAAITVLIEQGESLLELVMKIRISHCILHLTAPEKVPVANLPRLA